MVFINLLKHRLSHFKIKKIISGKTKGSISIYLSIVMVAVMLFISVVSESGRINVVYSESKSFTYMAADSVMAGYARQVFDEYGLLLVWENQNTEEELKKYIQANINMADLNGMGTNFMSTRLKNIEMDKVEYVTDNGEKLLLSQIASYTKYAAGATAAEELIKLFNKYEKRSDEKTDSVADVFDEKISENDSKELQNLVKDIDELIVKIKDVEKEKKLINAVSRIIERNVSSKDNDKVEKKYRSLRKILDKKAGMISRAIDLGKDYEGKKAAYLRESGYTSGEKDFVEENTLILKKMVGILQEEKALDISKLESIVPENINILNSSMSLLHNYINETESLKENQITEEDNRNKSIYESAKELLQKGLLSLVTDDVSDISNASISDLNLPSKKENTEKNGKTDLTDRALLALYGKRKFGNYISKIKDHDLSYEMEYIISGKSSDRENLTEVVKKIVGIRNVMNLGYLLTDSVKMSQLTFIASSAATAIGLPFLEPVIKAVLIEAWSLGEAVTDVKGLLKGNEVVFIKDKISWKTDIKNLLGGSIKNDKNSKKLSLNYEQYCMMLMMIADGNENLFRIMDLIQLNIQKKYNSKFQMSKCFSGMKFKAVYEIEPLFVAMPWVLNNLNESNGSYTYKVKCDMKY